MRHSVTPLCLFVLSLSILIPVVSNAADWTNDIPTTITTSSGDIDESSSDGNWLNTSDLTLENTGDGNIITDAYGNWTNEGAVTMTAAGSIDAYASNGEWSNTGEIYFDSTNFVTATGEFGWSNENILTIVAGESAYIRSYSGDWTNSGEIIANASSAGQIELDGSTNWTNKQSGVITATAGSLNTSSSSGAWSNAGELNVTAETDGIDMYGGDGTWTNKKSGVITAVAQSFISAYANGNWLNEGEINLTATSGSVDLYSNDTWLNQGTIDVEATAGSIDAHAGTDWTNDKTIIMEAAGSIDAYAGSGSWTNSNKAEMTASGDVDVHAGQAWTNDGDLAINTFGDIKAYANDGTWKNTDIFQADTNGIINASGQSGWINEKDIIFTSGQDKNILIRSLAGDWTNSGTIAASTYDPAKIQLDGSVNWTNERTGVITVSSGDLNASAGNGVWTNAGELYMTALTDNNSIAGNIDIHGGIQWVNSGIIEATADGDITATASHAWENNKDITMTSANGGINLSTSLGDWENTINGDMELTASGSISMNASSSIFVPGSWSNAGTLSATSTDEYVVMNADNGSWTNSGTAIFAANLGVELSASAEWENSGDLTISSDMGYVNLNAATNIGGDWTNTGNIKIGVMDQDGKIVAGIGDNASLNTTDANWINDGTIEVMANGDIYADVNQGNNNIWTNNGKIGLTSFSSVNVNSTGKWINTENGIITIDAGDKIEMYANNNNEWINDGTINAISQGAYIDASSYDGDWKNTGDLTLTGMDILARANNGSWLNENTLTLNAASTINIGGYGADNTSVNKGTINVVGNNEFGLVGGAEKIELENYGDIYLDAGVIYGEFDEFLNFSTTGFSSIINKKGMITDINVVDTDDVVVALEAEGITDFKIVRLGRVIQNGVDVAGTGSDTTFDALTAFTSVGSNTAIFLDTGAYDLDTASNTSITASLYSYRNGTPTVDPTVITTKTGAGSLVLSGNNTFYNGVFNVERGDLMIAGATSVPAGALNLSSSGSLTFGGVGLYTAGVRQFSAAGNTINMRVDLNETAPQADQLQISESMTGNALLNLTNVGGIGTTDDLKLVDIASGVTGVTSSSFALTGGKFDAGPYIYYLKQGSDADADSFYLWTQGAISNTFETMADAPISELAMVYTGMNSLEKRMGDIRRDNPDDHYGLWARTYAKQVKLDDHVKTDLTLGGIEAGLDVKAYQDDDNIVYAGVMAGYLGADNIKTKTDSSRKNKGDGTAPSVGAYATWVDKSGWFADLAVRSFWEDLDMTSYDSSGAPIKYGPKRQFTAASIEAGKEFKAGDVLIEPSLKMSYAFAKSTDENVSNGAKLEYGKTDSLRPRLGVKFSGAERGAFNPYLTAGATYEFLGKTDITYVGVKQTSDLGGFSGDVGLGFDSRMGENLSLYAEVGYEQGSKITAYSGNLGLRYTFGSYKKGTPETIQSGKTGEIRH